ncbi:MAG: hypothetical protein AAFO72_09530, partial [Pseudomonadota bacterium]
MTAKPYIVVHGGFHKTATSHVQSTLARNSKMLERAGVHYVNHRDTRKRLTVPVQCHAYLTLDIGWTPKITESELGQMTGVFLDEVTESGATRLIFSDENMAGHCGHCARFGKLYRWGHRMIEIFAAQFPQGVDEVHLGIRNYADFFASAYVEYLRSVTGQWFADEAHMRLMVLTRMPNWHKLLRHVAQSFRGAKVYVWCYEDFRALDQQILSNLCGPEVSVSDLAAPKDRNKRPSASGRAVSELLQRIHKDGAEEALKHRLDLQQKYPRGASYAAYDPWTAAERAHLTRVY